MRGVNKVILVGRVGNDPESKNSGDLTISKFSIATNSYNKERSTDKQVATEWHRCIAFGKLGDIVKNYVKKGSTVYVEGCLKTSKWKAKDGQERTSVDVIINTLEMLDRKTQNDQPTKKEQQQEFDDIIDF